jgi:hypothetical protein
VQHHARRAVFLLSILLGWPGPSLAAPISLAHYELDFRSLQLTLTFSGLPSVAVTGPSILRSRVSATAVGFPRRTNELSGAGRVFAGVPGASAIATATSDKLVLDVLATPFGDSSSASAESDYSYRFSVKNLVSVRASLDNRVRGDLSTDNFAEYATGDFFHLHSLAVQGVVVNGGVAGGPMAFGEAADGTDRRNAFNFRVDRLFWDFERPFSGDITIEGRIRLFAFAQSPTISVPEPATVLLLAAGLIALIAHAKPAQ